MEVTCEETKSRLEELANNIFFIVGCTRSGTTLLQAMLNGGPDIVIPPETHFFKKIWLRRYEFGDLREEKNLKSVFSYLDKTRFFLHLNVSSEAIERKIRQSDRSYRSIFIVVLNEYLKKTNRTRIGEKTPQHIHYIQEILTMFPKARIVNMIRDPRDVVNSLVKVPWSTASIFGNTRRWLECIRLHLRYSETLPEKSYINIKYEDLVAFPKQVLKRLCDFLDIDYTDKMLDFYQRKDAGFHKDEYWKRNTFYPVNEASLGRGKRELGRRSLMLIEWMTRREMKLLDYDRMYPINYTIPFILFASAVAHFCYLTTTAVKILFNSGPRELLRSRPGK